MVEAAQVEDPVDGRLFDVRGVLRADHHVAELTRPGNFAGTVINNNIGVSGVAKSGAGPAASGLNIDSQGTGTGTVSRR